MFELGKKYDITMLEWGVEGLGATQYFRMTAAVFEGSLVKFTTDQISIDIAGDIDEIPGKEIIVNTASQYFISAQPSS